MPRDDYDKLLKKIISSPVFQTKESDLEYTQYYVKIRNTNTLYIGHMEKGKDFKYNQGIFIDIFPINYIDTKVNRIYPFLRFLGKFFTANRFYIRYFNKDIYMLRYYEQSDSIFDACILNKIEEETI